MRAALAWATPFGKVNLTQAEPVVRPTFVEVKCNLATSRPPNCLTVHAGGKQRAQTISRVMGAHDNTPVVEFLREHCRQSTASGNRWMGTKIGIRIDPRTLTPKSLIDLDQAIVRAAESVCKAAGETYYTESNLTFILGFHVGVKGRPAPYEPASQL